MSGRDDGPAEYASPPCFLHELDPDWSGLGPPSADPDPACEFCRIASGDLPAHVVAEDAEIVAFVDAAPIREGHLQVITRAHYVCFDDLPAALAARIVTLGQRLARAQKALYGVERVGFAFSGNDVAHVHAHLIPLHHPTDLTSRRYIAEPALTFVGRPRASEAEMARVAAALAGALRRP
jgi:histidine triad (HIT) family protein